MPNRIPHHSSCMPMLRVACMIAAIFPAIGTPAPARAAEVRKERQSVIQTADLKIISSSALVKLLKEKLDNAYQDLELVIRSCRAGEFTTRAQGDAGLKGDWSVTTSSSTEANCDTDVKPEPDTAPTTGLVIDGEHFEGFAPEYVRKLLADKNTISNKALFQHVRDELRKQNFSNNPQYSSSGKAADDMTLHGGKKSNHAILFSPASSQGAMGNDRRHPVNDRLYQALKDTGYTDDEIDYLNHKDNKAGVSDGPATLAELDAALTRLRTNLNKNLREEKAYIYINAHGAFRETEVAYEDGRLDQPGGGVRLTSLNPTVTIFADNQDLLTALQEELPKSDMPGEFWMDDPDLHRDGLPFLTFTTFEESFVDEVNAEIFLNGLSAGTLQMGHESGADYQINLPDALVDQLLPDLLADGLLDVSFHLPNAFDSIRLAVLQDHLDPTFAPLDYGVGIGALVSGPAQVVPEPPSIAACLLALTAFSARRPQGKVRGRSSLSNNELRPL